jgi:Tol biopolymer transport system component
VVTAVSDVSYFLGLTWAPDSTRLAFTDYHRILVVPASGGEPVAVPTGFAGVILQLDWSPDGRTFAFSGVTGGEEEVWMMSDFLDLIDTGD